MENKGKSPRDELKYSKLKESLNQLPKVQAPDNFHFNLMTKITNQDYSSNLPKTKYGFFSKLVAATAFSLTAVIAFVLLNNNETSIDNPFNQIPELRAESELMKLDTINIGVAYSQKNSLKKSFASNDDSDNRPKRIRVVFKPNDVVVQEKIEYPFNKRKNVNLDELIGNEKLYNNNSVSSRFVSGGNQQRSFNGFSITSREDFEIIQMLKSRMDSIAKKIMMRQ